MDQFISFIVTNFVVLVVAIILSIILIRKYHTHKYLSVYLLSILSLTLVIVVLDFIQRYTQNEMKSVFLTTLLSSILYVLRPCCVLLFIVLCGQKVKSPLFYLLLIPVALDIIVVILPFIEATKTWVFYFTSSNVDGQIVVGWNGGDVAILRFFPHIVSLFYLSFLVYRFFALLKRKHMSDATSVFVCIVVVTIATVIETFFNDDGTVYLLPSSVALSAVFFYLFIYDRNMKVDILTGLFNRASYFDDILKFGKEITGIIQFDMNGLKYLNDNYGHLEGDKGLKTIANAIVHNETRKMYGYRLGGDEFIVLAVGENKDTILKFVDNFKKEISNTKYYCSIGYAHKNEVEGNYDQLFKFSEERMYQDKAEFYKTSKI